MKRLVLIFLMAMKCATADEAMTEAQWKSFFDPASSEKERLFECKNALHQFEVKERELGPVQVNGAEWQKSVVLFKGGPGSAKPVNVFRRVDASGLWQMQEGSEPSLSVPKPLKKGQRWTTGDETLSFRGIEDFQAFDGTVPGCVVFEGKSKDGETSLRYYAPGKGFVAKFTSKKDALVPDFSKVMKGLGLTEGKAK